MYRHSKPEQPRDRKRSPESKRLTIMRRQQRAAKQQGA